MGCGAHVIALRRESIEGVRGAMCSLDMLLSENGVDVKGLLQAPEDVIHSDNYILSAQEQIQLCIGILKNVASDSAFDLLLLKSQCGITFGCAQRVCANQFEITRRFVDGFSVSGK
jgi:hypothetical protein